MSPHQVSLQMMDYIMETEGGVLLRGREIEDDDPPAQMKAKLSRVSGLGVAVERGWKNNFQHVYPLSVK